MHLYFLRHGEAAFNPLQDSDRALTQTGIENSEQVAAYCAALGIGFSYIYSSPIKRAMQTAEIIAKKYPQLTIRTTEHLTPESDPRSLFTELKHHTMDSSLLLVTHEPFASSCISQLIGTSEQSRITMKTNSLAYVETDGSVHRGAGRLIWLSTPDIMKSLLAAK